MLQQMVQQFISAFYFPSANWKLILIAITFGIAFGVIWLALFRPPMLKKPWLWIVGIVSAFLTWTTVAFIQLPLQLWADQAANHFWDPNTLQYIHLKMLVGIPLTLLSGIVQEATKLVPVLFAWRYSKKSFNPQFGLIVGAVSGAGFGIFETIWNIIDIGTYGWIWSKIGIDGILSGLGSVVIHTSFTAIVGYGLTKGKGWQFYLIAVLLHSIMNYRIVLRSINQLTSNQQILYAAVITILIGTIALYLRWHKSKEIAGYKVT